MYEHVHVQDYKTNQLYLINRSHDQCASYTMYEHVHVQDYKTNQLYLINRSHDQMPHT